MLVGFETATVKVLRREDSDGDLDEDLQRFAAFLLRGGNNEGIPDPTS